ncbi:MAG: DUF4339 domain-containing protein [Bacteroides sp.]|nr:DUF4339 domain-containing protein [Bacteroides sp.]
MNYWIIIDGVQRGPLSLDEVVAQPGMQPSTPVWHEGLSDWTTAREIPEIAARFRNSASSANPYAGSRYQSAYGAYQNPYAQGQNPYGQNPYGNFNPGNSGGTPPMPDTYLVWAILATICCCIPTGIVAIIYASKVSPAYYRGDYMAAVEASSKAELWTIISFVAGLIWAPFSVILGGII